MSNNNNNNNDNRINKKYGNIRILQRRDNYNNQKKLVFKPTEPLHLNFNIDFDPRYVDILNKKLDLENIQDPNRPRLFHMRSEDNKMQYHNMELTKIIIKCQDCNFEHRITKLNIQKNMRLKKKLKVEVAKQHMQEYKNHKMIVHQTFEQWRPSNKL
jgi:hypothetical protein